MKKWIKWPLFKRTKKPEAPIQREPLYAHVIWKKYLDTTNETSVELISRLPTEFFSTILFNIESAYLFNLPNIILFEFEYEEVSEASQTDVIPENESPGIVSIVTKQEYHLVLEKLLSICELVERYEICSEILKIQNKLSKYKVSEEEKETLVTG